jgi:superoxide dismutase, Cu-Zn family
MPVFKTAFLTTLMGLSLSLTATAQTYDIKSSDSKPMGTIVLKSAPKGVLVRLEATGLTPGWHAIHFHEKGVCDDAKFASAGAHVHSPKPAVHGLLNPAANDSGDLPNIYADKDGRAFAEVFSTLVTFAKIDDRPSLMDPDGSSLIIHANPDDHTSQPIGGAGARVACAVIK